MEMQGEYVKELTLRRLIDAPRPRVWEAWTEPRMVASWWVPKGMTMPVCELDVRPGGRLLLHLSGYGNVNPVKGEFREVLKPQRLVFTNDGYPSVEATEPVTRSITTVTFEEAAGKTELHVHTGVLWTTPKAAQYLNGMDATWNGELDNLAEMLRAASGG